MEMTGKHYRTITHDIMVLQYTIEKEIMVINNQLLFSSELEKRGPFERNVYRYFSPNVTLV